MRSLGVAVGVAVCTACAPRNDVYVTKPGMTQAQLDRDTRACETQAERAADAQLRHAVEKAKVRNRVMMGCMRGRGYQVVDPPAGDKP